MSGGGDNRSGGGDGMSGGGMGGGGLSMAHGGQIQLGFVVLLATRVSPEHFL